MSAARMLLNATNATAGFCSGAVDSEGWESNHCRVENGLWHFAQLIFCLGYCGAWLRTAGNVRRFHKMEVYRLGMVVGSLLAMIWAGSIARGADQMAYYVLFFIINTLQLIWGTWYTIRRITFADHLNRLRKKMFDKNSYNLERIDFYNLVQEKAFLKTFKRGQSYIKEHDVPGALAILLTGKMHIYKTDDFQRKQLLMSHHTMHQQQKVEDSKKEMSYVGTVYPYEFINSYEWLAMQGISHHITGNSDTTSQVEIRVPNWPAEGRPRAADAVTSYNGVEEDFTEVQILEWKFSVLDYIFKEHPRLRTCIYALVGKDIAEKMLRITGHSIYDIDPSVDMVRRNYDTDCTWDVIKEGRCLGRRAAPRTPKDVLAMRGFGKRSISMYDDEHEMDEPLVKNENDEPVQKQVRNLTYVQERAKDAMGAGPWCDLPDDTLLRSPWTNLLFQGLTEEGLANTQSLQFDQEDATVGTPLRNRVWGGVPVVARAAASSFTDDKPFLVASEEIPATVDQEALLANKQENGLSEREVFGRQVRKRQAIDLKECFADKPLWFHKPQGAQGFKNGTFKDAAGAEWEGTKTINVYGFPTQESDAHHHLLNQAKFNLQKQRLRVANSRLLGLPPAPLESLNATSDSSQTGQLFQSSLLEYFEKTMTDLKKKDREEILKWGKWRTFYRPCTTLQRQGEEANYIGVVLQGKLAAYTVDEMTASKSLVHYIERFQLFGSEDFSSKFRTARRNIEMPDFEDIPEEAPEGPPLVLPQELDRKDERNHLDRVFSDKYGNKSHAKDKVVMYEKMTLKEAETYAQASSMMLNEDKEYLKQKIEQLRKDNVALGAEACDNEVSTMVTKIPTVMFVWDIRDLKRLMLADPHVESCLSILLRGDITYKLGNASEEALGTRVCGFHTQARGDGDVRVCGGT